MPKFYIEDIIKAKNFLNHFNSFPLEEIELYERSSDNLLCEFQIMLKPENIEEWKFIGLSNVDFITMEFYKNNL